MNANEQRLEDAAEPVCDGQGSGAMDDVPDGEIAVMGKDFTSGYFLWIEGVYTLDEYLMWMRRKNGAYVEANNAA